MPATCLRLAVLLILIVLVAAVVSEDGAQDNRERTSSNASRRTELTLNGLFNYYWKEDPADNVIKFLFACGQLGNLGTGESGKCSCYVPDKCVNCYRWWTALLVESVASYGIIMNTTNHSVVPEIIFKHSPYNSRWDPAVRCTYIDDFMWYAMAYLRVYDWLQDAKWLNRSVAIYDWAWKYGWDGDCGGFIWSNCPHSSFKFNIELVEAMHLSAKLAVALPDEKRFLNDSERIWQWFFSYDNGRGLMTDKFLVSTGAIPRTCCNATAKHKKCVNSMSEDGIYSQGLLLSASAYLYLATGKQTYLKTGLRAFEAVVQNYTSPNGVLLDEVQGFPSFVDKCFTKSDPGGDWFSFNGIFMLHLAYFTELLVKNGSMPKHTLEMVNTLVQKTSDSAWSKSAAWPPFNQPNACEPGSAPSKEKAREPKFHWWWREDVKLNPVIPADPDYYFRSSGLQCTSLNGNDTQIWKGQVGSENQCMKKCDGDTGCSKYSYLSYGYGESNCWMWSYNRSNHRCNIPSSEWAVGVKRPTGRATCLGKCDSSEAQPLEHGACYCDAKCSMHLDCCLDYATHCALTTPMSCKGLCDKDDIYGQAIPGGGYCWCHDGCNLGYTGGSCCPDYLQQCRSSSLQPCLDGRSQGSALNLFLSHCMVGKLSREA